MKAKGKVIRDDHLLKVSGGKCGDPKCVVCMLGKLSIIFSFCFVFIISFVHFMRLHRVALSYLSYT